MGKERAAGSWERWELLRRYRAASDLERRDAEPRSRAKSHLFALLRFHFPRSRATWDLPHVFQLDQERVKMVFDVSFFHETAIEGDLISYDASAFGDRVPDLAVNVLSRASWDLDLLDAANLASILQIPYYAVFAAYHAATEDYRPPFLRLFSPDHAMSPITVRETACKEGETWVNEDALISMATLPFRLGIMERAKPLNSGDPGYLLTLFELERPERLLLPREQEREDRLRAEARAEEERRARLEAERELAELKRRLDLE